VLAVEKVLARKTGFVYWVDMHLEVPRGMTVEGATMLHTRSRIEFDSSFPRSPRCRSMWNRIHGKISV
jgi:divalent metal cation (Fe/Co/Zn/Cd) transporter